MRLAHSSSLPKPPRRAAVPGSAGLWQWEGRWKGTVPGVTGRGRKAHPAFPLPGAAERPVLPVPGFLRHSRAVASARTLRRTAFHPGPQGSGKAGPGQPAV